MRKHKRYILHILDENEGWTIEVKHRQVIFRFITLFQIPSVCSVRSDTRQGSITIEAPNFFTEKNATLTLVYFQNSSLSKYRT